jgi:hypothetical protein
MWQTPMALVTALTGEYTADESSKPENRRRG